MDSLVVHGGRPLNGIVRVEGAKNAALPVMAAALAVNGSVTLNNVPDLVDVSTMTALLRSLNADVSATADNQLTIESGGQSSCVAKYDLVSQMRASICVLGPLLARFGTARVSLPGGCNIGHRPVDLHLQGLAALGADIKIANGYVVAQSSRLRGAEISLAGKHGTTVTGTCNILVAASLAKGRTIIRSAALEPEVVDLGRFLNSTGAEIEGLGTDVIEVRGVDELHGASHSIISDRIEATTLAVAAAISTGNITVANAPIKQMSSAIQLLQQIGVAVTIDQGSDLLVESQMPLSAVDFTAKPYPGVPTDCQAQFMALLTCAHGRSEIRDAVFPERFMHASELMRMGARIERRQDCAIVEGGEGLSGADVMASDLRASAALVIAALAAEGESTIRRIYHLDRGYVGLERKLQSLGARIGRFSENAAPRPHVLNGAAPKSRRTKH